MNDRRYRWTLVAFFLLLAVTWWRPIHPYEQALHHSLTVLGLAALLAFHRRRGLPYSSFLLILIFLALHSVAARWMYSFVPYDDWTGALFGVRVSDVLGWERNNFDRFVHLTYGLCFGAVVFRMMRSRWAWLIAVEIVLSTSALYELFEWGIAVTLSPSDAEAYNGQQGDIWDAHKDMALAAVGALISVLILMVRRRRRRPAVPGSDDLSASCPGSMPGRLQELAGGDQLRKYHVVALTTQCRSPGPRVDL